MFFLEIRLLIIDLDTHVLKIQPLRKFMSYLPMMIVDREALIVGLSVLSLSRLLRQ